MKGILNKNQIDYLFFHLGFVFEITDELRSCFNFEDQLDKKRNYIRFKFSEKAFSLEDIENIENIPVLFPLSQEKRFYYFENNNLIFEHDILKSAFYLLSGYQEWKSKHVDYYKRFPYEQSIQSKLDFVKKPIVNYYFEIIAKGIKEFCLVHKIPFKRKKLTDTFCFLLSHDIDLIDNYNYYEVGNKFKQAVGLTKPLYTKSKSIKIFLNYLFNWINPFIKKNPYWSFDKLLKVEKENNINATYFFLERDQKHLNSYYKFSDPRIRNLIKKLETHNAEIGLHGTIRSADSEDALKNTLKNLLSESNQEVLGVRQHTLKYSHPDTLKIHEEAGIKYDTTLGFAAHEGFRNSYCLPFKLYDFENDKMINVWEFPLMVMDATLFGYRKLSYENAKQSINQLLDEVIKFNGIFTLLWHNSFFEEIIFSGITSFYEELIKLIISKNPESITGKELLSKLNK